MISQISHAYLNIFHVRTDFLKLAESKSFAIDCTRSKEFNDKRNNKILWNVFSFNRNISFDFTISVKYWRKYSREHFQLLTYKMACGPVLVETRLTGNLVAFFIHVPLFLRNLAKKKRDVSSMITIHSNYYFQKVNRWKDWTESRVVNFSVCFPSFYIEQTGKYFSSRLLLSPQTLLLLSNCPTESL